ncbi:response regulator transcription factor [Streptomyces sp. 769]|uniref:response regulator n=1 Tax=Streptomyces sp. 769 TaxID=1262452 RepID=UPI00057F4918|nr:response regulator transcription factor [Streptomyces sp. 769]AJC53621.1 LuxR response regulator receiver [Streptomyces sp. 769]
MTIRVLVVDDEELFRCGLGNLVSMDPGISVVGAARDGAEAVRLAGTCRPDVVLMDIRMPGMDGLTATRKIHTLPDAPKVIVLTTFDLDEYVHSALQAGAMGFLLKDTPPRDLVQAVKVVHKGEAMLAPTATRRLITHFSQRNSTLSDAARGRLSDLTEREREVLYLVAEGMPNAEIAAKLSMTEATVKTHVSRSLNKLGCANRVQAALVVFDAGYRRP